MPRRLMLCTVPLRASKSLKRVAVYWRPWSECTMSPAEGRRTTKARRLGVQAVGFEHAADAPAAHGVALGLHLGPQAARAISSW